MLKGDSGNPEAELAIAWAESEDERMQQAEATGAPPLNRNSARFRACLWLSLAADIRRHAS